MSIYTSSNTNSLEEFFSETTQLHGKKKLPYIPYTYLIKFKPTGQVYYGVKFGKNAHPSTFWVDYFTSSKIVKLLIKEFGETSFDYQIRKTFKNAKLADEWETKVLRRCKVRYNNKFMNIDDCQSPRSAIQNKMKTKFISNENTKKCIRIPFDITIPEGWIQGNINHPSTSHSKGTIWCHDPITLKSKMVKTLSEIPNGWDKGRPKTHGNSETLKSKMFKWITNGKENLLLQHDQLIPESFHFGKTRNSKEIESNLDFHKEWKNSKFYNNGFINKKFKENDIVPTGWFLGKLGSSTPIKYIIDTKNNIKIIPYGENVPKGWKIKYKSKGQYVFINNGLQENMILISDKIPNGWTTGKISRMWITNEIDNQFIFRNQPIPEGWRIGMSGKRKVE